MEDQATIAALFAQVYAQPDDDQVRHVLADALIARGDPRGELIQLQLQPASDHARRTMQLLQQHGITWLGELRRVVLPVAYERGFLASCLVVARPGDALRCAEWGTVHTVELTGEATGFERTPEMTALRTIVNPTPNQLLQLANHGLEHVTVVTRHSLLLDEMLGRFFPVNSIGALIIDDVPIDHLDRVRALASRHDRMKLSLRPLPPRYEGAGE